MAGALAGPPTVASAGPSLDCGAALRRRGGAWHADLAVPANRPGRTSHDVRVWAATV